MPVKWKIFRILDYIHIAGVAAIALFVIYRILEYPPHGSDWGWIFLFLLANAVLITNAILNAYLLEKCYPQKYPGSNIRRFSIVLFILSGLLMLGLAVLLAFVINELFFTTYYDGSPRRINREDILLFSTLLTILLTGLATLSMQLGLWNSVRRNYQLSLDRFLGPE